MLQLDAATLVSLPLDRLGLALLADLVEAKATDTRAYFKLYLRPLKDSPDALRALGEGFAWLRAQQYVAEAMWGSADTYFITRAGRAALAVRPG